MLTHITLKQPQTTKATVWLNAYGGHYDVIVVALKDPAELKEDDDIPKESMTIGAGEFMEWFMPQEQLIELGIWTPVGRAWDVDPPRDKWVKVTMDLPAWLRPASKPYGIEHQAYYDYFGLDINVDGYL